jgi:hypothetical protein
MSFEQHVEVERKPRLGPREYGGKCCYPLCDHMGYGSRSKCACRKWERERDERTAREETRA